MIYNRTINDITEAKKIIDAKVKQFQELSESDVTTLERGTVTYNTLNRIETKQKELKEIVNSMGYYNCEISNKEWSIYDIFDSVEFNRLIDNNSLLRTAFIVFRDTPLDAIAQYDYEEFNRIEKILVDIESMITEIEQRYRICGEYICGEE